MAGTSRTSKASSVKAPAAPKEDPRVKELEAKVAKLEAALASLEKSLIGLQSAPAPVPTSRDEGLREELREYFRTVGNTKVRTHKPNID